MLFFTIFFFFFGCFKKYSITIQSNKENEVNFSGSDKNIDTNSELYKPKTISRNIVLIVYVRADSEPHQFIDESGKLKGFFPDIDTAVFKYMNQKYKFVVYDDIGRAVEELKTGLAHAACATPVTPDFSKMFNIVPYMNTDFYTFVHKENTNIKGNTFNELLNSYRGKKIGVQTRGQIQNLLREYSGINIIEFETSTVALKNLSEKKIDATHDVKEVGLYYAKKNNWAVKVVGPAILNVEAGLGFSRAIDQEIVSRYRTALKEIKNNGTYRKIWNKWFR